MDQETTLRTLYESLNAGDAARAAALLTDDCTFPIRLSKRRVPSVAAWPAKSS
jgi:hypothetical protein